MEAAILIITSLIFVIFGLFLYLYFKNIKKQEKKNEELYQKLENLQKLVHTYNNELKSTNEAAFNLIIKEIEGHKNTINSFIKELSSKYESQNKHFNDFVQTLLTDNNEFKRELKESHQQSLKTIQKELNNILTEIKSPLNLD